MQRCRITRGVSVASGFALPDPDPRWSDLRKRVLSAGVLLPVALGCLWYGGLPFTVLIAVAAFGMAYEWVAMCGRGGWTRPGAMLPPIALAASILAGGGYAVTGLEALAIGTAVLLAFGRSIASRATLAIGLPYAGIGAVALVWLRTDVQAGFSNVLFLLLIVWGSDIGAYLSGRLFGGKKLAPAISPGKTWSGAAGGLICAVGVALAAAWCLDPTSTIWRAGLVGAILGVVAQMGDLLESAIKRHFGVKDSGKLIPGHGGLLDRLDAVLLAAPVAAMLALWAGRGVVLWE